jgi:hypothetical protein
LAVLRWPLLILLAGCSPAAPGDFLEAHGAFADGTAIDVRLSAQTLRTSAQPQLTNIIALTAAANGPGTLRALRLEWIPGTITLGAAMPSAPSGPVIFYVGSPLPDGGAFDAELSVVNGGAITFTENDRRAAGTLANLVLARNGQTLVTINSGSFLATNP